MAEIDAPVPQKLIKIRRLEAHDLTGYRELRLESLKSHPEAFASAWEDEAGKPASWWTERLETSVVFGGWIDDSALLGVAGLHVNTAAKLRHRGVLWGMTVVASNTVACRLYSAAGFEQYGLERRALTVGHEYYDEVLMALALRQPTVPDMK